MNFFSWWQKMADTEDIQPLVCDNGTGMVKVPLQATFIFEICKLI